MPIEVHVMPHNNHDRILVVEDQPEVRQAAVRLLKALGHTTVEADQASAALAILEGDDHFDLLFTDIVMPGAMNGVDLRWRSGAGTRCCRSCSPRVTWSPN
ncbi:response regulator [Emcibacter sp. SYSU 3D8]|uniref:response regulator n=1 Tax=Emcibacter sp. SYSU 3D8 TaxID=3133969 RepID=UPI0031FE73C5